MRLILVFCTVFLSFNTFSAADPLLGTRANVMECSHAEVVAYMELPDAERRALQNYEAWQSAYQSSEVKKSETDPSACVGLLYGDLQVMGDRIKNATSQLMSMTLPSMSSVMGSLGDKLLEGVCSRIEAGNSKIIEQTLAEANTVRQEEQAKLERKYGQVAMDKQVTKAIIPPKFQAMGMSYRNGEIDKTQFRAKVRSRWLNELDELEKSATGL